MNEDNRPLRGKRGCFLSGTISLVEPDMWRTWKEKFLLLNRFTLNSFDNQLDLILFDSSR